mgnify:CR=1 FL=1
MSLSSLPDGPLKLVMQHVPLKDRLASCCLVSKRLHAAAVAATDTVVLRREDSVSGLQWLYQYGENVVKLEIYQLTQPLRQLPCPNLRELKLGRAISVQLGPSAPDGTPGVVRCCTNLTRLELFCNIVDGPEFDGVSSLSRLVHLQYLNFLPRRSGSGPPNSSAQALPGAVLPCLSHLTFLHVGCMSVENLLQLGALSHLQSLSVKADVPVGPSSIPGLALPASLTKLKVWSRMETGLLCLPPSGLQDLMLECAVDGPAEGPDSLLSCVARLQQLTSLELRPYEDAAGAESSLCWPPVGPAYSALTASSKLAVLDMDNVFMPADAWQCIFPASHTLPHLTSLLVTFDSVQWGEPPSACA